MISYQ
jgi:hypothetical protein